MSRVEPLVLQAGDEKVLREWTRASSISAGLAQRARILLLAAEGRSNTEIGQLVGVSLPTVRFSTDPELEAKIRDVVGLYLDPPTKAVVVCVDEKTQIQALDRTAPILP